MGWIDLESPYDDGTYDNPGATQSISDELYDIIIAAYPEKPFLFVRPYSTLANGYEFRCVTTSTAPLTAGIDTNVARLATI